jgi:hypothetical protein
LTLFEAPLGLAFLHYPSGRLGVLHQLDQDHHGAGPGAMGRNPIEVEVLLSRAPNGAIQGARYRAGSGDQWFERLPPFRRVNTTISHGQVALAASATLPAGDGPFPVVVMNHGGGPGVRSDLQIWADYFAGLGVAAVTYDKRGSGETTGPAWDTFEDLAADAAAATSWAKGEAWAKSGCVGTWAYSQSGWVVPLAIQREGVAFVIAVSIPVISPAQRAVASVRPRLVADGLSQRDADEARDFIELVNQFGRGMVSWSDYNRALEAARNSAWFDRVEKPTTEDAPSSPFYTTQYGRYLDPLPYWADLDMPLLAIYGGLDTTVPSNSNAPLLMNAVAGRRASIVAVLADANHQMLRAVTGGDAELIDLNTYAHGYFALIEGFVARHVVAHC